MEELKMSNQKNNIFIEDNKVIRTYDPTAVLQYNYYSRNQGLGGWLDKSKNFRLVAHIDMNLVKSLADTGDTDAYDYYYYHNEKARDRMIEKHKELFKAV
jgi:hypothetical protein